jgi:hypothetical protein
LHWGVTWTRAGLALVVAAAVGLALVSGGSSADPRTPAALPGLPPPFLGTALAGSGGMTAAVDAYGDVVDLRPSPAGQALIDNPSDRQAAGSVAADTGIVPRLSLGGGPALAPWQADSVRQRYLPGTNVVVSELRFGPARERVTVGVAGADRGSALSRNPSQSTAALAVVVAAAAPPGARAAVTLGVHLADGAGIDCRSAGGDATAVLVCGGAAGDLDQESIHRAARVLLAGAAAGDRTWLSRARPLSPQAPTWARRMYERSLLTLRALTDSRTGAVAAGARDGWAHVWPRDAATAALAFAAAGYEPQARRIARFLGRLDLAKAARFDGNGEPVPGRTAQGDATGWAAVAARAAHLPAPTDGTRVASDWRDRADYQEGAPGDYLANAIATVGANSPAPQVDGPQTQDMEASAADRREGAALAREFGSGGGLVRRAGDPRSGLDSAAAWAVRPFALPALYPAARLTLLHRVSRQTRFGITPGEAWPGADPWTAPTAWSAWALAALGRESAFTSAQRRSMQTRAPDRTGAAVVDRRQALRLLGDLRRAATPAGALPERVDARTGVARSTTPLAWSHAFALLTLQELWPTP